MKAYQRQREQDAGKAGIAYQEPRRQGIDHRRGGASHFLHRRVTSSSENWARTIRRPKYILLNKSDAEMVTNISVNKAAAFQQDVVQDRQ
jgi:hypothetical protein